MSGGSLNYAYSRVEDIAQDVLRRSETNLHRAFAKHLFDVAQALHDLEWVLSGDYAYGEESESIRKVVSRNEELETAKEEAKKLIAELEEFVKENNNAKQQ